MSSPVMQRFMRHVNKTKSCWLWTGTTSGSGAKYPYFRVGTRQTDPRTPAHRWLYEQLVGPIPPGLELDHVALRGCTSKLCVNPDHLEPVTHAENMRRAIGMCRKNLHDLRDPKNVRHVSGQRAGCKPCRQAWERDRWSRRRMQ